MFYEAQGNWWQMTEYLVIKPMKDVYAINYSLDRCSPI